MKIATVLSVSALLAMFSAVACSSPTTPAGGDKSDSADSAGDNDKDPTPAKKSTSTATNDNTAAATTTTPTTNTTTAADGAADACDSCMAAKDPKVAAMFDCMDKADSQAAADACAKTAGCDSDDPNNACGKAAAACQTQCDAADQAEQQQEQQQEAACTACVASNTQASAIEKCYGAAQSDADAKKCDAMQCDDTCESAYDKCDKECAF